MTDKPLGKLCGVCGEPMSNFPSISVRICTGCKCVEPWDLEDGRQPLISSNRDKRRK